MVDKAVAKSTTTAEKAIDLTFHAANADNPDNRPRRTCIKIRPRHQFMPAAETISARSSKAAEHQ
ncbi:MAG: hypothetical protein GY889_16640 [Proteobacteria bacterium]|nr:hypothetical protein [Pseudomonadota bacterium]